MDDIDLGCVPTAIDLGRARAFHNAARIQAKFVYSRERSNELWLESHSAATAPTAAAPANIQFYKEPLNPDRSVDGDVVNLGYTIDGRKGREIPVISESVYNRGLEYYKYAMWEEPNEKIRPSIQQFTCLRPCVQRGWIHVRGLQCFRSTSHAYRQIPEI